MRSSASIDGQHPAVRSVSFGDQTGLEYWVAERPRLHRVRRVAEGILVDFHARARMEDNEITMRNPAHFAKSQCF
jgi:hypothetical protein